MSGLRNFILEMDIFAHGTFLRYKSEESYRTMIGGIISIILIVFFVAIFARLIINTVNKDIIISEKAINF